MSLAFMPRTKGVCRMSELGFNRIYNMDCMEGMKLLPDKSIDLVVTDPPFAIDFKVL